MRSPRSVVAVTIAALALATAACATVASPSSERVSPAQRWRRIQDSLSADQAMASQGPRVTIDASFTTYGGSRRVRSTFRTQDDAYVLVGHIDSDGNLRVVYPESPAQSGFVRGGHSYMVPEFFGGFETNYAFRRRTNTLYSQTLGARYASYDGGTGYVFVIATWQPMDFRQLAEDGRWARFTLDNPADATDPRAAVDELAAELSGSAAQQYSVEFARYFRSNYRPDLTSTSMMQGCSYGYGSGYGNRLGWTGFGFGFVSSAFDPLGGSPMGFGYTEMMDPYTGCAMYVPMYAGYGGTGWYYPTNGTPRVRPRFPYDGRPVTPGDTATTRADSVRFRTRAGGPVLMPALSSPTDVDGVDARDRGFLLTGAPVADSTHAPRRLTPRDMAPGQPFGQGTGIRDRSNAGSDEEPPRAQPRTRPEPRQPSEPRMEPRQEPRQTPEPRQAPEPRSEPRQVEPRIERPAPPPRVEAPRVERDKPPQG